MGRRPTGLLSLAACLGLCGCTFYVPPGFGDLGSFVTRIGRSRDGIHLIPVDAASRPAEETGADGEPRNDRSAVGAFPFSAVASDVKFLFTDPGPVVVRQKGEDFTFSRTLTVVNAILSLPVDIALDAVLSPVDLVLWAFGHRKNWPGDS